MERRSPASSPLAVSSVYHLHCLSISSPSPPIVRCWLIIAMGKDPVRVLVTGAAGLLFVVFLFLFFAVFLAWFDQCLWVASFSGFLVDFFDRGCVLSRKFLFFVVIMFVGLIWDFFFVYFFYYYYEMFGSLLISWECLFCLCRTWIFFFNSCRFWVCFWGDWMLRWIS